MSLRLIQSNAILNFIMFNVLISNLGFLKLLITYEIIANFPWCNLTFLGENHSKNCKYKRAFRGCNMLFIWINHYDFVALHSMWIIFL